MSERVEAAGQAKQEKEKHEQLINRVMTDPALRQRLKQRPKDVLREAGIDVPQDVEVTVVDFDPKHRYLFLPPAR
jgi:Nitrile hydratase, alpha chain